MLLKEARETIGLADNDKAVSGKARIVELKKLEVILKNASTSQENFENKLIELVCKWENKHAPEKPVSYSTEYQSEDLQDLHERLMDLLTFDSATLRALVVRELSALNIKNLDEKILNQIVAELGATDTDDEDINSDLSDKQGAAT